MTDDLAWLDAVDTAALIAGRQASAREVVTAAIERIEAANSRLNAVVIRFYEQALDCLDAVPPGRLHGVPFLWKDSGSALAGMPLYRGSAVLRDADHRATDDSPLAVRYVAAGLVGLGKTNVPELAQQMCTQPVAFGPTRNPWDLTRSAGGSSGASAAAVAAGLVPLAHGGDAGGSIRIPAAFCGVVGFKPSRGRMPLGGSNTSAGFTEHVLTRTVRDSALVLDLTHGPSGGELFVAPHPTRPYVEEVSAVPGRLRIGLQTTSPGVSVDPVAAAAAEEAALTLSALGHDVEISGPVTEWRDLRAEHGVFQGAEDAAEMRLRLAELAEVLGRPITPDDVEPWTWSRAAYGQRIPPEAVLAEARLKQANAARMTRWWDDFDLLITPTAPFAAPPLEFLAASVDIATMVERVRLLGCFRLLANHAGLPAVSLPTHVAPSGLPLGVQLVAGPYRDDVVFQVAGQLEQALPWVDRYRQLGELTTVQVS